MARRPLSQRQKMILMVIWYIRLRDMIMIYFFHYVIAMLELMKKSRRRNVHSAKRSITLGLRNLNEFLSSDGSCFDQLRMDRNTFHTLCGLLRTHGALKESKNMFIEERVAIFLNILGHDSKQRSLVRRLKRSKETITRNFRQVLRSVLRLYKLLIKTPEPIQEDCTDERWKWFKNCLGALDGTYIKLRVYEQDKCRYRNRKGALSTNVLGACSLDMQFTYFLAGWEGSAADGRILQDALSRRHPFKVPRGCYYLVDAGYTNCEGFLAPYRGQKYHLNEWREGYQPTTFEEFFNMKHSSARNVIERCFGLLKMRWAILRNVSFYDANTCTDIISACCLLHNLIRREMNWDPLEPLLDTDYGRQIMEGNNVNQELINIVETSNVWTAWRDSLGQQMFDSWMFRRGVHHNSEGGL